MQKNNLRILLLFVLFVSVTLQGCNDYKKKDMVFVNQDGAKVRLEDFRGKFVLMNFIYTSCPNEGCDLMTLQMLRVQNLLKDKIGKELVILSVSIDPRRDTPEVLKGFASKYRANPDGWQFLTGNPDVIEQFGASYGVVWSTFPDKTRHHSVVFALLDRNGKKVKEFNDKNYDAMKMVEEITSAIESAKAGKHMGRGVPGG